ncbi:MAG: ABC transporter substrate-binding protein [Acidimicrobiales bacterium]
MKAVKINAVLVSGALVLGAMGAGLVATSAGAAKKPSQKTTTTLKKPKPINLSGVTLNIGDISEQVELGLVASGEITPTSTSGVFSVTGYPFKLDFTQFIAGPQAIAGIVGGSIDVAVSADTPVIFAEAQGVKFKTIAVVDPNVPGADFSIVLAKNSQITSLSELKGLTISAQTSTINEYFALQALASVGLNEHQVTVDNLTPPLAEAALSSGAIQAAVLPEPYVSLEKAAGLKVLTSGVGFIDGYEFLDAAQSALANPAKAAAIGDLLTLIGKAQQWDAANQAALAQQLATLDSLPLALATVIITDTIGSFVPINAAVISKTQTEATVFFNNSELSAPVNASSIFDARYNSTIAPFVKS